ncbi:MAG: RNA-binding protein [Gammaproteobacteria bacterium]|nr:RNA-binding protein [Gammaproteobacteria bacterium]MBQ0838423.1 RNA-binding protein [Gammaproteobacteria bacterium]
MEKVRIDKWLWAARFFKTRALSKAAIEGGKVHVGGQRVKASKELTAGTELTIRQGWDEKQIRVDALSDKRRGAPEAAALYTETEQSILAREQLAAERKAASSSHYPPDQRPNKKQRRQIHRFQREQELD